MAAITDLFKRMKNVLTKKKVLSNNDNYVFIDSSKSNITQPSGFSHISTYVKTSPELIAIINSFVSDIVSDGYHFKGPVNNVEQAKKNADLIDLKEVLTKWLLESYSYGNGFLVINQVTEQQILDKVKELSAKYKFETKEARKQLHYKGKEAVNKTRYKSTSLTNLPAQTVSIFANNKYADKIYYKQKVDDNEVLFDNQSVIHFKDIDIDGKLWGYPRLYSFKSELQILANLKDYIGSFFDNNATPNYAIIAENLHPGTPEYNSLKKMLASIREPENRQKNLLLTSKIKFEKLNDFNKDMEFKELASYLTSICSMAYGMPPNRFGQASGASSEEVTLTNQGYYRTISCEQDKIEKLLNRKYFQPLFGVELFFNRTYKEDETREANTLKTKLDVIEQGKRLGLITRKKAAQMLGIDESDLPDKEDWDNNEPENQFMQGQKRAVDLEDEPQKNKKLNKTPEQYKGTNSDNKLKK
jgi:hypothetical protein